MTINRESHGGSALFLVFQVALILMYIFCTEYDDDNPAAKLARYAQYQDVHIMIFVGFGFLMCFLHRAGFTATSHAFLVAAMSVLWCILCRGFFERAIGEHGRWTRIKINIFSLITGDFCAGAVLISFGAMIGRLSANQLLLMAFFEVILYNINEAILVYKFYVADIGGTMIIHCFGAYFGLACAWALDRKQDTKGKSTYNNKGSPVTDTMAMVGTLFLFCFWPSFNSALAGQAYPEVQQRTAVNTLLAICSSTFVTFAVCRFLHEGKFRMVEVQNATLAGGVAIGAAADMVTTPGGAMIIGSVAGLISVLGYKFLQPWLEEKIGLRDTCGVHNLHGMPSVFGAICAVIVARAATHDDYRGTLSDTFLKRDGGVGERTAHVQANYQLASLAVTLALAVPGGLLTGFLLHWLPTLSYFFIDNCEYEGLEGHGTSGANVKSQVRLLLQMSNRDNDASLTALRRTYFAKWKAFKRSASSNRRVLLPTQRPTPGYVPTLGGGNARPDHMPTGKNEQELEPVFQ
jgi:ammonium transporter Rh